MGKRALLRKIALDVRASYWFLPFILVVAAALLAFATEFIDRRPDALFFTVPDWLISGQAQSARTLLSTIAGSIIGVTGVMFSMTIVAVSFATGNLGPRLIGNFMRDRGNQWSLGILISTFVYSLLILRSIHGPQEAGPGAFVPQLSIMIALLLTFLSIFTMIYFIHHIPETINVSRITADLGRRFAREIRHAIDAELAAEHRDDWPDGPPTDTIFIPATGYIQAVDDAELQSRAEDNGWFIQIVNGPGSFVTPGHEIMRIWANGKIDDESREAMQESFATGNSRTETQNIGFIAEQFVEMIGRALSPGINDPYTALNCYNWLFAGLEVCKTYRGGLSGLPRGRISGLVVNYDLLFQVSFEKSWAYAESDKMVAQHWKALVERLSEADPARIRDDVEQSG